MSAAGFRICTKTWLTPAEGIVTSDSLVGLIWKSGNSSSNTTGGPSDRDNGERKASAIDAVKRTRTTLLVLLLMFARTTKEDQLTASSFSWVWEKESAMAVQFVESRWAPARPVCLYSH